jgi:hypothetical protein
MNYSNDGYGIGYGGMEKIRLDYDKDQWMAFVDTAMNRRVSYRVREFLRSFTTGGISRKMHLHIWKIFTLWRDPV